MPEVAFHPMRNSNGRVEFAGYGGKSSTIKKKVSQKN
jgi:hypothetical protein